SFQFAYQPLVGDGTIVARWTGAQQVANGGTRFGVMIREGPTPSGSTAFMEITGGYALEYLYRATTGAGMGTANGTSVQAPYWWKLVRVGNVFTAYGSADGISWSQVGSPQTITMGTTAYAGLAVTSSSSTTNTSVTFDNVTVSGADFTLSAPSPSS